jgi:aminoglycoside phosphotransferase (APT) family kinase protein
MARLVPSEGQLRTLVAHYFSSDLGSAQIVHHCSNTHVYLTLADATRVIVRICDGPYWTNKADKIIKFKREQFAWERLKRVNGICTPQVIAIETGEAILPYPFLVMTYIPGTQMSKVFPALSHAEQLHLIKELGSIMRDIHALEIASAPFPGEMMRWDALQDEFHAHIKELSRCQMISSGACQKLTRLLNLYASQLASMDADRVFLHGDLHFDNILLARHKEEWHISGLLDAELSGIGPRGTELRALEAYSLRPLRVHGLRKALLRGYGEKFGPEAYKLAYLIWELAPDCVNKELLEVIESSSDLEDLEWIGIFGL